MAITAPTGREHHWDAARALLMLLGIPYHVAMSYRAGHGEWIANAHESAAGLAEIAQIIHIFRMPAFFLIAGYFSALLLARRDPLAWLRGRAVRLGVPFLAAFVTLVPLMNYACELSNFGEARAWEVWKINTATSGGYVIRHLWFIIVLLYLSSLAAAATAIFPTLRRAAPSADVDACLARRFPLVLATGAIVVGLWEAVAIELFYHWGFATMIPQQWLRIDELLTYLPWFLIGCVVARSPALKARLYRFSWPIALVAVAATIFDLVWVPGLWAPVGRFFEAIASIATTQLVIAGMKRIADRPHGFVQEFTDASFVIYLFHLPIICWLVVLFIGVPMPVPVKALIVLMLTASFSYGMWRLVRPRPHLRFAFDGRWPRVAQSTQSRPMSR